MSNLQIEQHETEERELKMTVHVEEKRVQEAMRSRARTLARQLRIPGFRPGKAPYNVVVRWVGKEALRGEAIDALTEHVYREAIDQVDAAPIAPGSLDNIDVEPLVLHFTIPLEPQVELGDYRSVRVDPPAVEVTDDEVNEALETIQEKHVLLEPANRPAQQGDVIIADLNVTRQENVLLDRENAELLLDPEKLYRDTPFVDNVVGLSAGEEKSFVLSSRYEPSDEDEDGDGDEDQDDSDPITYHIKVHEVKSRYVPPLNDHLAQEEEYESLLAMRLDVRTKLSQDAQRRADAEYTNQVFDKIAAGAQVVYPPAAVEQEIDSMIADMERRFSQQGWKLDDYLGMQGKTGDTLRQEMRSEAVTRVTRSQVTLALIRAEKLSLEDVDLDQRIDERLGDMGDLDQEVADQLRTIYASGQGRMLIANDLLMEKFNQRLMLIGQGEAPELPEPSDEEE